MKREISFRAYNKRDKKMYYNVQNTYDFGCTGDNSVMEDRFADLLNDDEWVVMEYTGLSDKYGTKIFEGDILREYSNVIDDWIVSYEYGKFIGTCDNVCEDVYELSDLEVIGNICENNSESEVEKI